MNKLFRQIGLMLILLVAISLGSCTSKYSYETVPNDPLKARIYTLDNGLKVYMTVNKGNTAHTDVHCRTCRWKERPCRNNRVSSLL